MARTGHLLKLKPAAVIFIQILIDGVENLDILFVIGCYVRKASQECENDLIFTVSDGKFVALSLRQIFFSHLIDQRLEIRIRFILGREHIFVQSDGFKIDVFNVRMGAELKNVNIIRTQRLVAMDLARHKKANITRLKWKLDRAGKRTNASPFHINQLDLLVIMCNKVQVFVFKLDIRKAADGTMLPFK